MADALYARAAATAARLLAKYGKPLTLRTITPGNYDVATSTSTPLTADDPRNGALFDFGAGVTTFRNNLVQTGDKRLYLEPGLIRPLPQSIVIDGSDQYSIVSIGEINPGGASVLFDLHVRK